MFRWTLHNIDTGQVQVLKKDPRGYEDLILKHEKSPHWHGVHYNFSTELGFFCKGGGKELVDAAYDSKSQEAKVKIKLEVKCNGVWQTILKGKLDFSVYRQEYRNNTLYSFLNANNEDIIELIRNREDLEVNLLDNTSLDGLTLNDYPYLGYNVNMHSKVIHIESEWETVYHGCCFQFPTVGIKAFYLIPTTNVIQADFEKTTDTDSRCVRPLTFDNFLDDAQFIVNTTNSPVFIEPNIVRVTWEHLGSITITTYEPSPISSSCDSNCGSEAEDSKLYDSFDIALRLFFGNPDGGTISEADDCGSVPIAQEGIKYIDLVTVNTFAVSGNPTVKVFSSGGQQTRDILLNPGDKVWYYWVADVNTIEAMDMKIEFEYNDSQLILESDTTAPVSTAKAIAIHEAWSRLSEKITDQNLAFYSEFFGRTDSNIVYDTDGCGSRCAITSGKNIRQIDNNPPIIQSLKSMFDNCDAIWGIGLGIERYLNVDVLRVEEVDYFYSPVEILKLDFVPNIQMRHLEDKVYNEISIGFKKWETENVNGLDEPLTRINYVVPPIKSNKQKFERISEFVAGMYAIELTRRAIEETKDTRYDEDTFILALRDGDLNSCERDENMLNISGLISPETAYNLRFLLSSTFDRLKNQFVSGLTKLGTLANPVLMPSQMEGNAFVVYQYANNGCAGDHRGTFQLNAGAGKYPDAQARRDNPIWEPIEYTFDYPLEFDRYLLLIANPYGLIRFSNTDLGELSGWITSVEYNVRRKTGSFTLLKRFSGVQPDLTMIPSLGDYSPLDYDSNDYFT